MANHPQESEAFPRQCGGWLALSGESEVVRIGVTAPTEAEAQARLATALAAWRLILASPDVASSASEPHAVCH